MRNLNNVLKSLARALPKVLNLNAEDACVDIAYSILVGDEEVDQHLDLASQEWSQDMKQDLLVTYIQLLRLLALKVTRRTNARALVRVCACCTSLSIVFQEKALADMVPVCLQRELVHKMAAALEASIAGSSSTLARPSVAALVPTACSMLLTLDAWLHSAAAPSSQLVQRFLADVSKSKIVDHVCSWLEGPNSPHGSQFSDTLVMGCTSILDLLAHLPGPASLPAQRFVSHRLVSFLSHRDGDTTYGLPLDSFRDLDKLLIPSDMYLEVVVPAFVTVSFHTWTTAAPSPGSAATSQQPPVRYLKPAQAAQLCDRIQKLRAPGSSTPDPTEWLLDEEFVKLLFCRTTLVFFMAGVTNLDTIGDSQLLQKFFSDIDCRGRYASQVLFMHACCVACCFLLTRCCAFTIAVDHIISTPDAEQHLQDIFDQLSDSESSCHQFTLQHTLPPLTNCPQ